MLALIDAVIVLFAACAVVGAWQLWNLAIEAKKSNDHIKELIHVLRK